MYKFLIMYLAVFIVALTLTVVLERKLIPLLTKRAKQPIYEGGPAWHSAKSGTPTMGGVAFLIAISSAILLSLPFVIALGDKKSALVLISVLLYSAMNSVIGIIDDMTKLKRKKNAGLSPAQKILFQTILAFAFLLVQKLFLGIPTALSFSFGEIELGFFYYPLGILLLLGIINCANLTDGIDGLAGCVAFAIGISLFYISLYLTPEVAVLSAALIGGAIGFLAFNLHPAKIFMGDTGSLFLGAIAVSAVFALGNPMLIIFIGGIYVLEGISVILQVIFFKATRKRLFKMAPIHHHLEKCGISENTICIIAILLTFLFSIPAYIMYLP